jgi:hypothetical protein
MPANTDWFKNAKWGVFCHYLGAPASSDGGAELTAEAWDEQVSAFDVAGLAQQILSTGARYFFITLGQNSGHYCSPNATYDAFVGISPSKCSRRDLVADLHAALSPHGVKLLVYSPAGAPAADPVAMEKLGWEWGYEGGWPHAWGTKLTGKRLAAFQVKWEAIIREWSLRWGDKVCGWWFDGCYFADDMYRFPEPPNFESFAAAAKAGNPNSLVAFNPGVLTPVVSISRFEDYTAGEIAEAFPACPGRWVDAPPSYPGDEAHPGNTQYHILSYLGPTWGSGEPRFCDEFVVGYTKDVAAKGGVVTWDVPILKSGLIPEAFVRQLSALKEI